MTLVNEITDKMCKRTRWLTSRGQHFFFHKETVVTVAEYSLVIKPRAEILPIVFYCWISLFILFMWSVRHKFSYTNNVSAHAGVTLKKIQINKIK